MNTKEVSYGKILQLAFPVIISQLGQITVGLVDNIMIGRLGTLELAAASFVNNIFNLAIFFGTGVTIIITPLVGEAIGSKNKQVSSILKNGLFTAVLIGLFVIGLLCLSSLFFDKMGQEPALIKMSKEYFLLLVISYLPLMLFNAFKQFADGTGDTKTGMIIILGGNLVNILGNYIFIFGKFGFTEMALNGAAIGTILSRIFMFLAFIWVFGVKKRFNNYLGDFKLVQIKLETVIKIGKKGVLLGLQMLIEAGAFGFAGIMIGWLGAPGLAAHQIAISLSNLGFMIYLGMGAATTILISQSYGAGSKTQMHNEARKSVWLTVPLSIGLSLFFFLLRNYLPGIFTEDAEVKRIASTLLIVLALYQLPDALQIIYTAAVRAMADVKLPVIYLLLSYFVISLPVAYAFAFVLGYKHVGIWIAFPIGMCFAYLFMRFRFFRLLKMV